MKLTTVIIVAAAMLTSSACVNIRHDVSSHREAWGAYHAGTTYALRQDVFLVHVDSGLEPSRRALVPPSAANRGSGYYSSPRSIDEWNKDPVAATHIDYQYFTNIIQVVAVINQGTLFAPRSIKRNSGWDVWFGNHTHDTIYGEILTGEFKGTIVDLADISWCMEDKDVLNKYVQREKTANHDDSPNTHSPSAQGVDGR